MLLVIRKVQVKNTRHNISTKIAKIKRNDNT